MIRRAIVGSVILAVFSLGPAIAGRQAVPGGGQDFAARARRIHAETIGIDSHIDTLQRVLNGKEDISRRTGKGHVDLPRLKEAGMRAPFFALYVPTYYKGAEAVRRTLQLRDAMQAVLDAHPDQIELAVSASDIERIGKTGKIAAVLTIESGHAIADDLAVLRTYHRLGIRSMTLTHFRNTNWADSSTDTPAHNGLTDFGREVVREMNRLGMIVDLSHTSPGTMSDALDVTRAPVIFSHSSARGVTDHPRNVPDSILARLPKNGGVVMVTFVTSFVSKAAMEWERQAGEARGRLREVADSTERRRLRDEWMRANPRPAVTVRDVADHIEHIRRVAGVDHVGIGGDYDGTDWLPEGLEDVSAYPNLFAELIRRGWSDRDLRKLAGGNILRVMRQAEAAAEGSGNRAASR